MLDSHAHVDFDVFQQLVLWLSKSMLSSRQGRNYLESTPILMTDTIDKQLMRLIYAHAQDHQEVVEQMRQHLFLLQDVRRRGKNDLAIRESYVNMFGGLALDIPEWLLKVEDDCIALCKLRRPERTRKTQIGMLEKALHRALKDGNIVQETIAALHNELGNLLLQGPLDLSYKEQIRSIKKAISCHESALQVYTALRYPLQYAKTLMLLGIAYQRLSCTERPAAIDHAIACYKSALEVYKRDEFPEPWIKLHILLGSAYTQCPNGNAEQNLEQAITYHETALQSITDTNFSVLAAVIQLHLGDTFLLRRAGQRQDNVERAMSYYRVAVHTFTPQQFPNAWAYIHIRLATVFQELQAATEEERERNLRCAIVCYEGALEVYSLDAYPVEHADILLRLASAHRLRNAKGQQRHRKQAADCYRKALKIFTSNDFPAHHAYIQLLLTEVEGPLDTPFVRSEPSFHTPFNSCIMVKSS